MHDTSDSPRAWLMVAAAFIAAFIVFGITYSFGVFLEPMATELHANRTVVSAFFSIAGFGYYMLGPFTGHLSDRFGPRVVVGVGAVAMGIGLVLTAFIEQMWVGYLTYGIGLGVGAACVYVPTLANVGGWFIKRRSTALGIAAAGTGCGMLIMPPLAAALIEHYGWRLAEVIFGCGSALGLLACAAVVSTPPLVTGAAKPSLRRVVGSFEFVMLYVSWVLATTALFVPFVFLPAFARDHGASEVAGAALISVVGGASVIGRLALGFMGDRIATFPLFKLAVFMMGISYAVWLFSPSYESLIVFAIVLGVGYGSRISLLPGVLIDYFGLQNLATILGVFLTGGGLSAVLGPLLASFIVDATGDYSWGIFYALIVGMCGFGALIPLRNAQLGSVYWQVATGETADSG